MFDGSCLFSSIEINLRRIHKGDSTKHITNDDLRDLVVNKSEEYFNNNPNAWTNELISYDMPNTEPNRQMWLTNWQQDMAKRKGWGDIHCINILREHLNLRIVTFMTKEMSLDKANVVNINGKNM